jgi:HEAT repeat protein
VGIVWLAAIGLATTLGQATPSRSPSPLAPGEASLSPSERTPEEQALVESMTRAALQEGQADTDVPARVRAAAGSGNPWVRASAFASAAIALGALQNSATSRARERAVELSAVFAGLVDAGLRDGEASVRRAALSTGAGLERSATGSTAWLQRCRELFTADPSGPVRAVAFDVLVSRRVMPELDPAIVERAIADPSPSVKAAGFSALWLRQAPGYLATMLARLHDERDGNTRVAAAEALRYVVPIDGTVVDAVAARLAAEQDPAVRQRLSATLAQMKDLAARVRKPGA